MARPGGPMTIRQAVLDAGVQPRCASTAPAVAGVRHRLVTLRYGLGRSRIAFAARAGATARNLDRGRGRDTGRTALDLLSNRLAPTGADTAGRGAAPPRVLLDTEVPPDVVIAVTDPLAVGVLREARRQGLRPGTDVAATSVDDSPPASVVDGGPTSVRHPVERFARTAVDLLDSANGDRGVVPPAEIISPGSGPIRLTEQDVN